MFISNFVKGCISLTAKRKARYTKAEHQEAIFINQGWECSPWALKREHILPVLKCRPWEASRRFKRLNVKRKTVKK